MMGAGGFIKNPGWEILSGDDLMGEDYENDINVENVFTDDEDLDLTGQVVLYLSPAAEEMNQDESDEDDLIDDEADDDDEDDEEYVPSGEELWEDNDYSPAMSSDSSSELSD